MATKMERIITFLEIAQTISKLSTCLSRQTGAVIIDPKTYRIISYGYNGAPSKVKSCLETGKCFRKDAKTGHVLNICMATHAEVNAIVNAAKTSQCSINNAVMIATDKPCLNCLKVIVNSGIKIVYYDNEYTIPDEEKDIYNRIVSESKIKLIKLYEWDKLPKLKKKENHNEK